MQLNISTDYAIRAMVFLALHEGRANAAEISEAMCIPVNTCKKNLHLLKKAALVCPYPGVQGGYSLAKTPEEIKIADVMKAVGETQEINRCLEEDAFCSRNATENCPVRKLYQRTQEALDATFNTTLQEISDHCKDQ